MGAALGNQHPIPVLQLFDGRHTLQRLREKALVPGHEDGEGAERHLPGHNGAHRLEGLTVGDHQTDVIHPVLIHECNRILKLLRLTADRPGMVVENLRQHHLLRQNQSPLGGRAVHRDHQNEEIARCHQTLQQILRLQHGLSQSADKGLQKIDILVRKGADPDLAVEQLLLCCPPGQCLRPVLPGCCRL